MGEHMADINALPIVMDHRDHPELVPADIKDRARSHIVRRSKCGLDGIEIGEISRLQDTKPGCERISGHWMNDPEFPQRPPRDDTHTFSPFRHYLILRYTTTPRIKRCTWREE